jgi:glycosyltransferase involved in cell wall biosynthesis
MRILIATGIYPPQVGGVSYYAVSLKEAFEKDGHKVGITTYRLEKLLPTGVRHALFFSRVFFRMIFADYVIALDTFSVGWPTTLAGRLLGKKVVIRTGGDFLWESYVERTRDKIPLSKFYAEHKPFTKKEKIIYSFTKKTLHRANIIVFSTEYQRSIFIENYSLEIDKTAIIENFYGEKRESSRPKKKLFLSAGRNIVWKNFDTLREAFAIAKKQNPAIELEISEQVSRDELMEKISESYAVIVPSIGGEISPNTILEAIMYNKPFLLESENGLMNRIETIGMFFDSLDTDDMAEKILWMSDDSVCSDYKKRVSLFSFTHSYNDIAREFIELYGKL